MLYRAQVSIRCCRAHLRRNEIPELHNIRSGYGRNFHVGSISEESEKLLHRFAVEIRRLERLGVTGLLGGPLVLLPLLVSEAREPVFTAFLSRYAGHVTLDNKTYNIRASPRDTAKQLFLLFKRIPAPARTSVEAFDNMNLKIPHHPVVTS